MATVDATVGRALVTGASSGIGAAFARALAQRGHSLLLVARRRDRLEALAAELGGAEILAADLADSAGVDAVAARARALGDLAVLVNNAGFGTRGAFATLDGARESEMVRLNVLAPMALTHQLLPLLPKGGGIINIASIGAFQPVPFMATYGATKAFVLSWSEALAEELRPSGRRVLCVCPGPTESEFFDIAGLPEPMRALPHTMSAETLVRRSLAAWDDDRAVLTPGVINWLTAFLIRFAPRFLVRVVTGRMFAPRPAKALPP